MNKSILVLWCGLGLFAFGCVSENAKTDVSPTTQATNSFHHANRGPASANDASWPGHLLKCQPVRDSHENVHVGLLCFLDNQATTEKAQVLSCEILRRAVNPDHPEWKSRPHVLSLSLVGQDTESAELSIDDTSVRIKKAAMTAEISDSGRVSYRCAE